MKKIIILVQKYHKDNSLVHCSNLSEPEANFLLHYNYINKFDRPLQIGKYYLVDYGKTPSECRKYMNHRINVITELSPADALSLTLK